MKKPLVARVSINIDVLYDEAGIAMRGSKFHW